MAKAEQNSTYWDRKTPYFARHAINKTTENKKIEALLYKYLNHHGFNSFLEVGCACGALFGILKDLYGRRVEDQYFGIDIAKNSILMAHLLYPGGWFKWMDVRDYKFIQEYDIIYSSEVLPHLALEFQKKVIKQLITHAKNFCLFSLKYSDIEPLEHRFLSKELPVYFTFPNYEDITEFIKSIAGEDKEIKFYRTPGCNKAFIKNTEFYGKTGNLTVQITKREAYL